MTSLPREEIDYEDVDRFVQTAPRQKLGVYTLFFRDSSLPALDARSSATLHSSSSWTTSFREVYADVSSGLPAVVRFLADLYLLVPRRLLLVYVMNHILYATNSAVQTALTTTMLSAVEVGIRGGHIDRVLVICSLVLRALHSVLMDHIRTTDRAASQELQSRMEKHYDLLIMQALLSQDYAHWEEKKGRDSHQANRAWRAFEGLVYSASSILTLFSQVAVVTTLLRASGLSPVTFLLVLGSQIMLQRSSLRQDIWSRGVIYLSESQEFLRLRRAMEIASANAHRQEVVSGHLGDRLLHDHRAAREALKTDVTLEPYEQVQSASSDVWNVISRLFGEWPAISFSIGALVGSTTVSFSAITSLQSTVRSTASLYRQLVGNRRWQRHLKDLRDLYDALEVRPDPTANDTHYPCTRTDSKGMKIAFRKVSFSYPGSKSAHPALSDVSFDILPGQLVVIVGANGSGKSSLVKQLIALHTPSSGSIQVDDAPLGSYRIKDLRRATASLSQDHTLFPLSIGENIGVGRPEHAGDYQLVKQAAELAGAARVMRKMGDGYDTVIHPVKTKQRRGEIGSGTPLEKIHRLVEKQQDVSGGERQRLVAARTFMRIATGDVRLVVVDEPSAAMDPAGEFELFRNLREAREGKTMIFITHRFGHLVKHADLILCMKEGQLIEKGTHAELLESGGEYADLYNVQAQAFV